VCRVIAALRGRLLMLYTVCKVEQFVLTIMKRRLLLLLLLLLPIFITVNEYITGRHLDLSVTIKETPGSINE